MSNVIPKEYREKFASSSIPHSNDDQFAALLYHYLHIGGILSLERLNEVAHANAISLDEYKNLNNGMQRMNVGNRLRALWRQGNDVKIGALVIRGRLS